MTSALPALPKLEGEWLTSRDALRAMAHDFGNMVHHEPVAVARPRTIDDVVEVVRYAGAHGLRVVGRGMGHTTQGQSQLARGIVIDMTSLATIHAVTPSYVEVDAGVLWCDLLNATLRQNLTPPAMTDYLRLTVGGVLSVGGVGGQSYRHGLVVDNVLELTVVTGQGDVVACSAQHHPELFEACRGGLGLFGLIVRAKLRLVAAPKYASTTHQVCADLSTFLATLDQLAETLSRGYLLGSVVYQEGKRALDIEVTSYADAAEPRPDGAPAQTYAEHANRLEGMEHALEATGSWRSWHPWLDLFVRRDRAEELITLALQLVGPELMGDGYIMLYPLRRSRCTSSFVALPDAEELLLFDILPSIPTSQPQALERFRRISEQLYDTATRMGATVYPIGFPVGSRMGREEWRRQLGPRHERFERLKQRYDELSILAPRNQVF